MDRDKIKERFLEETKDHTMQVLQDEGLYRHLSCSKGGSVYSSFDVITWPGYLTICGDMGCYTFCRIQSMFEFFVDTFNKEKLEINPGYWSEKLVATDRVSGVTEFSPTRFSQAVKDHFDNFWEDGDEDSRLKKECWEQIEEEVLANDLGSSERDAIEAYDRATQFRYDKDGFCFEFTDFWEVNCNEYTFRYIWCCYAIVWAIQQYNKGKEESTEKEIGT